MARNNELQEWKDRLTVSHRKFATVDHKIRRAWEYYKGNQWATSGWDDYGYKDHVVDNVVFANIRAIVPRLNFKNPKIFISPKKKPFRTSAGVFDTLAASASLELVMNYYYKVLGIKREARKCLYDALLSPWGIMELGYTLRTEKVQSNELIEINELIEEDSPFCVRRDPKDFRSDPEGIDARLNDARWIALRWVKSLDDVKKDPKYSNTSRLEPNFTVKTDFMSPNTGYPTTRPEEERGLWERVEGWDIWDRKKRKVMTIVQEHDRFLRNDKSWPLDLEGFPVETFYFNENSTDIYPIPDVWLYLDMQDELNRIGSMQLDHVRRVSQRRYLARSNALSDEEIHKLTHGGDGTVAMTDMNPQDSVLPLQDATISQDIYMTRQGLKRTIREMAGVSDTEALASTKFEQATEPRLIEQAAMSIRGDQQSAFENFLVRIVQKLGKIIQQTADEIDIPLDREQMSDTDMRALIEGKLAKIAGPEGAVILLPWLELRKDDLKGDYVYDIEVGSTMPVNEEVRKRDALTLYTTLQENPYVRGRVGTKEVLEAFNKPDPDKYLKTEEEVSQEQQAAQEAATQAELALDLPKRQVDLQKTQLKVASSDKQAVMKSATTLAQQEMKSDDADRQNRTKILTESLKALKPEKKAKE